VPSLVGATLLSGCSHSLDIYFANPCGRPIVVHTYSESPDLINGRAPDATATVPATSVTKVEQAFVDGPDKRWALAFDDGKPQPFDGSTIVHGTVVVPSSACG
jgi:hypothetical protein